MHVSPTVISHIDVFGHFKLQIYSLEVTEYEQGDGQKYKRHGTTEQIDVS